MPPLWMIPGRRSRIRCLEDKKRITMTRHTRIRRDPAGQLHRRAPGGSSCLCGCGDLCDTALAREAVLVEDQALPNLDRWLTVLEFFSVAVMLGALVWVVRVAASITSSDAGNAWAPRVPEPGASAGLRWAM